MQQVEAIISHNGIPIGNPIGNIRRTIKADHILEMPRLGAFFNY